MQGLDESICVTDLPNISVTNQLPRFQSLSNSCAEVIFALSRDHYTRRRGVVFVVGVTSPVGTERRRKLLLMCNTGEKQGNEEQSGHPSETCDIPTGASS